VAALKGLFLPASVIVAVVVAIAAARSDVQTRRTLDIYVVDVEGGKATLIVSPSGESLLVDSGNIGEGAHRDAGRILAAVSDAGLKQIDHLVTTHWHRDHIGAMSLLARQMPILEFIDHGANIQPDEIVDAFLRQTYPELHRRSRHTVASAGDTVRVAGLKVRIVISHGEATSDSLTDGGSPNPFCPAVSRGTADRSENSQSIGIHIAFGRFRLLDLGDLPVDKELDLMCPINRIGTVDLFMVSHHGQPAANSQALVHAIRPRVAIMNNGTRKGGQPQVMKVLHTAPGLEDLWQLHFSLLSGQEYTAPGLFIANTTDDPQPAMPIEPMPTPPRGTGGPPPAHDGTAQWIKVMASRDGSFTVTNGRNGFSKTYTARAGH
jgi:beta-lactamase superfamily II metal-dependent hydrolase